MISNNKISHTISSQVPFFVRNDHPNFVTFLEKYYEYLEQNDKVVNRIKNVQTYQNVDLTESQYSELLYNTFLKYIPKNILADKTLILKHIKDFYRAKGTEKATRFLMRILYDIEIDFYYPKKDILRASDGKWYIQKSLRITDTQVSNVVNSAITGLEKYIKTTIKGSYSNTTATVEKVDRYYDQGTLIDELILSNINGSFINGEIIYTITGDTFISSNVFGGIINSITITNAGTGYSIGDPVLILSNTGYGACATIASVTTGNISFITVLSGGAGYQNSSNVLITGGGGSGASVSAVLQSRIGVLRSYYFTTNREKIIVNANFGSVDYDNGTVVFNSLRSTDVLDNDYYSKGYLTYSIPVKEENIHTMKNRILTIDVNDARSIQITAISE